MEEPNNEAATTTSIYYDSKDADTFYYEVWGGEDIHVGLYESENESIFDASLRTKMTMASFLDDLSRDSRVLDIGSGFGGTSRYLAKTFGCKVVALNLSTVQNERHRQMNIQQELADLIDVIDGNFEDMPFEDSSFDIVWSQDAILHRGSRAKVISEVSRVLTGNGDFVFTDPMQSVGCPENVLQPILERLSLDSLASPQFYRDASKSHGLEEVRFEELTTHLVTHYTRVLQETQAQEHELTGSVTQLYIENMIKGLKYWIDGGNKGYLEWGIFQFRKAPVTSRPA
jgi:sarcosine/dimethylglycine N-methyltransferase